MKPTQAAERTVPVHKPDEKPLFYPHRPGNTNASVSLTVSPTLRDAAAYYLVPSHQHSPIEGEGVCL